MLQLLLSILLVAVLAVGAIGLNIDKQEMANAAVQQTVDLYEKVQRDNLETCRRYDQNVADGWIVYLDDSPISNPSTVDLATGKYRVKFDDTKHVVNVYTREEVK